MKLHSILIIFIFVFLSGCASITNLERSCGSPPNDDICLGGGTVPSGKEELFETSSTQAVDALKSDQFKEELERFHSLFSKNGPHSKAWENVDVSLVPNSLIGEVDGMTITTYGGASGWFKKLAFGNMAFDGEKDGPIKLNRWALKRSSASIANTIVHEAAHRIGLIHPNSSNDLEIADCEPPYVIGSLVEKYIDGKNWNSAGDCHLFKSPEWNEI